MRALATLMAAGALLLGCDEPQLPKSWRVTYARVLAVRAEVAGDATRATPEPGERARVSVLIVGDRPIDHLSYDLVACPATPALGELPSCAGEAISAEAGQLMASSELARELHLDIDVPDAGELDGAERILIAGTICTDGTAEAVEGGEGRCVDGAAEPVTFTAHVVLALDAAGRNGNPVLADDAIRFDDEVWIRAAALEPPTDEDGGGAPELPDAGAPATVAADGVEHEIAISLEHAARETSEAGPEELLLSHYVTAGVLERRFSVLERDQDGKSPMLVKWHMPRVDDPPSHMLAVFVLRDQRGGVDYALREIEIADP